MNRHQLERGPRARRTLVIAALVGLSFLATAGVADAGPRHKHRHGKHGCNHHSRHAVVVREAPCADGRYRSVYAEPVYAAPCAPVVYREVYRPGYWQWHEASHCNVWVPGVTIAVRF